MGVPAYYKKLITTINGLVSKSLSLSDNDITWLWMDFNCLIYHCLQRKDLSSYPGHDKKVEWEDELINSVIRYTLKIISKVNPKKGVRICIDGIVPMGKMRQQRLRRFKSAWLTNNGIGKDDKPLLDPTKEEWDTNSITPGTDFMNRLKRRLLKMSADYPDKRIHISGADEPGEGEHKIMSDWRTKSFGNKGFAIYGLDADLIILSLLNREILELNRIYLFREELSAGKIERDSLGEEEFEWFSIDVLREYLCNEIEKEKYRLFIINYCFSMSILGNDFLPSSLGLKIRTDGHTQLIQTLISLFKRNIYLINDTDLSISKDGLTSLFSSLAIEEEHRISHYIDRKIGESYSLGLQQQNIVLPIGDNNYPLCHIEESSLRLDKKMLVNNWEDEYMKLLGINYTLAEQEQQKICQDYLYTIQWIWNYYTGQDNNVCYNWYYSYKLPPLWKWLSNTLSNYSIESCGTETVKISLKDIIPVEQLCLVLPLESWNLIPKCKQKILPIIAPQYFPSDFTFDTVGKRFFWECEPEIPLISICEIKALIQ